MTTLGFSKVGNIYESEPTQFGKDTVLELNYESVPEVVGVKISIKQSLSKEGWQTCFSDTLRQGTTWCKTLQGVSENAWYKVVSEIQPKSANYE